MVPSMKALFRMLRINYTYDLIVINNGDADFGLTLCIIYYVSGII